jgi:hypothetical protein
MVEDNRSQAVLRATDSRHPSTDELADQVATFVEAVWTPRNAWRQAPASARRARLGLPVAEEAIRFSPRFGEELRRRLTAVPHLDRATRERVQLACEAFDAELVRRAHAPQDACRDFAVELARLVPLDRPASTRRTARLRSALGGVLGWIRRRAAQQRALHVLGAVGLVSIVGFGAFLRLWNLGRVGFRGDEAVYAGQAAVLAGVEGMQRYFILMSRGTSNFLLYQNIVSLLYRAFGTSDTLARVVAATCSTLTILVTFLIASVLYSSRRVALYAALLLAFSSYSVALGRLALLDSTLTLLVALAVLCLSRWDRTNQPAWLYAFAASAALAIQAKIVGVLLFAILGAYLLVSRRRLTLRTTAIAAATFLVFLSPVVLNLAYNAQEFLEFLSRSSQRASQVPWYYYLKLLIHHEGGVVVLVWAVGLVAAVARRSRADLLPALWLAVFLGFYQFYPLKAFNYLLPTIPALCLLAANAVKLPRLPRAWRTPVTATLVVLLIAGAAPFQWRTVHDDSFAGMKEAARWLAANSPDGAGIMTISHGSAQYVFSFYGQSDAYPFGRFRLATVLPGGTVVHPLPSPRGTTPRDWVALWPPRLLQDRKVSYLVYYATSVKIDDPEEDKLVRTSTQRRFRELIARYGGKLVHTVYVNREGRVWIYKVTRLRAKPVLTHTVRGGMVRIRGKGFAMNAPVTIHYHRRLITWALTDQRGSLEVRFPVPTRVRAAYHIVATDTEGNYASFSGVARPHA